METSLFDPFLWIGIIFANFNCDGNIPCVKDELIMSERMRLKFGILAAAFNASILESEVDLCFKDSIMSSTSVWLVGVRYILLCTGFFLNAV